MTTQLIQSHAAHGPDPSHRSGLSELLSLPLGKIATVLGVLGVLAAALFALAAYSEHKAAIRKAETDRYVQAFEQGPVALAWTRLSRAWDAERPRQRALLERFQSLPENRRPTLSDYRLFILESIEERGLGDEINTVLSYFRGLALCIRIGNCDGRRAANYFGDLPWQFRNQHFLYLSETHPGMPFDVDFQTVAPRDADHLELVGP